MWRACDQTLPGDREIFHLQYVAPDRFLLEKGLPQAPATWLRTCRCPWPSWKGRSLFQGVPAGPPSPSSALRNLSSGGWCWVLGHNHLLLPNCKSMCPMHSEAKEYQKYQFGTEEGLLQGPARRCLKNPKFPESFQQSPFLGKVREGCGELLQTFWRQNLCF